MKVLGILSFIILVLGITFYIRSPYIHIAFFEGPIGPREHNSDKQPSPRIAHQNTNPNPGINRTSQSRIETKKTRRRSPSPSSEKFIARIREQNSDIYRIDGIKELVSQLSQNLSGNDLLDILTLFDSDIYRVDATRALQYRLKPSYSNSVLGGISQLFTSDSYRTEIFTLLR